MTTIKLKNGSGAPLAGDLVQGEPALDLTNKRLYTEDSGGTVIEVGTNPTSLTTGTVTADNLEIGTLGASNSNTFIDLTGDTTYTDFGFRIVRNSGANGRTDLRHRGTGDFVIEAVEAAGIAFETTDTERMRVDASGNVGIGENNPQHNLHIKGSGDTGIQLTKDGVIAGRVSAVTTGLSFGVDGANGTTERMRIDASGNVGIGTNPDNKLHVYKGASGHSWSFDSGDGFILENSDSVSLNIATPSANSANILFSDADARGQGRIVYNHGSDYMGFHTAGVGNERMRIDSSGNLLVGKTSAGGVATVGAELRGSAGYVISTASSDKSGWFGRNSTDGDIVGFYKDGTTVGSVGVQGSRPYFGNNINFSIKCDDFANGSLVPANQSGVPSNNVSDIGGPSNIWNDLYLGGGVYLGGTGSANKLDDYEEGTWSPIVRGSSTAGSYTYSDGFGLYTKIGRQVTITFYLGSITEVTAGTGYLQIHGCPFTKTSSQFVAGTATVQSVDWNNVNSYGMLEFTSANSTSTLYVRLNGDNYGGSDLLLNELISGQSDIGGTITFFV